MKFINERRYAAIRMAAMLACVAWAIMATGIQVGAATPFSFVAIGDTRTEPYLTGGDIPVFGYQGATLDESSYWQLFDDELLSRLPPPDKSLGLP